MVDMSHVSEKKINTSDLIYKYIRPEHLPHIWCPGCSNGIILRDLAQAIENLHLERDKVVIVSGIGCTSRAAGYLDFNTIHTTHGRALAFATGIKLANPELEVIVISGDGDASAIGGNHLIHAARRNIGLTLLVLNNSIYAMTGGQFSPTTPSHDYATTSPFGNLDRDFDIAQLALAAGASYAARGNAFHTNVTTKLIQDGIAHKGFSVIDIMSICPTYYGRKNKKGDAVEMMMYQKENTVTVAKANNMSKEELEGKLVIGLLNQSNDYPEYTEAYLKMINDLKEKENG